MLKVHVCFDYSLLKAINLLLTRPRVKLLKIMKMQIELCFFSESHLNNLNYTLNENQLPFVRSPTFSLSINPAFQGKGIAKVAMLQVGDFIKTHFPTCNEIILSVNTRNENAYQLYR